MRRLFLAQYIRNIRMVGAVTPSSKFLARKMVARIDFDHARVLVEYGPGTGVFTSELVRRIHADAVLVVIEHNRAFYEQLAARYEGHASVIVVHDSAENVQAILQHHGIKRTVDYIVSGLPFAALPQAVSQAILAVTQKLIAGRGVFVTFQYTLLKKQLLAEYFAQIDSDREYRNVPPAYVLYCRNNQK